MQSYSNAAARTDASLTKFPPVTAHQVRSGPQSVQQIEASKPPERDPDTTKKRKRSESATGVSESSKNKQPQEESPPAASTNTALVDDDIDWTAITAAPDMQLSSAAEADAIQLSAEELDTGLAHSQQAEAAGASECLQQQQAAVAEHGVLSSGDDTGDKHVQHAVGEYVKALLDPFYKAGIVDREVDPLYLLAYAASLVLVHGLHAQLLVCCMMLVICTLRLHLVPCIYVLCQLQLGRLCRRLSYIAKCCSCILSCV